MNWILVLILFSGPTTNMFVKEQRATFNTQKECRAAGEKALHDMKDDHGGFFRCTFRY